MSVLMTHKEADPTGLLRSLFVGNEADPAGPRETGNQVGPKFGWGPAAFERARTWLPGGPGPEPEPVPEPYVCEYVSTRYIGYTLF